MTSRIPLAGVIGSPIAHSRSPRLHGHWLKRYEIAGHYVPMDVATDDLANALRMLPRVGFVGVNVTLPHKERVLALSDVATDRAAIMGAANTLIFRADGKIHADNTDGIGFIENLRQNAPDWNAADGAVAMIGAGGAARAVVSSLLDAGAPEIRVTNRTKGKAEALRSEFGSKINVIDWVKAPEVFDEGVRTVVNASALGMTGKSEMKLELDKLTSDMLVTDLVYTPLETRLLAEARAKGCQTVDGLGMLLHQAVPGFERWFGVRPEVDAEAREAVL